MKTFLRRLLKTILGLTVLFVGFHLVENWRGRRAWNQWRQTREALGDHFEYGPMIPPQVPDEDNFFRAPLGVLPTPSNYLVDTTSGDWRLGKKADFETIRRELKGRDLKTVLEPFHPSLALLEKASNRKGSRAQKDYSDWDLGYALGFRARGRVLKMRALTRLHEGQSQAAMEDVLTGLRVSQHIKMEPTLMSQLLRLAWMSFIMQPIWEGLHDHRWDPAQLNRLQHELDKVDLISSWQRSLAWERISTIRSYEQMVQSDQRIPTVPGYLAPKPQFLVWIQKVLVPKGWVYQNLIHSDHLILEQIERVFNPGQHIIHADEGRASQDAFSHMKNGPYTMMHKTMMAALLGQQVRVTRIQSGIDQAIIVCALEQYRSSHGTYPDTLEQLVPDQFAQVPHDVVEGRPIKYQRTGKDTFRLYSLGWNGTDEGGKIAPGGNASIEQGDWVW